MRRGVARTARRGMGVLTPRQPWAWLALLVAGLTVGLFITQGRGFAAKYQAVALVCGASAAVCAGCLSTPSTLERCSDRAALACDLRRGFRRIGFGRGPRGTGDAV